MSVSVFAPLIVLASNLDVLVFVYAATAALVDAGLISAVGVAVWIRVAGE